MVPNECEGRKQLARAFEESYPYNLYLSTYRAKSQDIRVKKPLKNEFFGVIPLFSINYIKNTVNITIFAIISYT